MLKNAAISGAILALITGIAIGFQAYLSGQAGSLIGPIKTGFWTNFLGGIMAGFLILVYLFLSAHNSSPSPVQRLS